MRKEREILRFPACLIPPHWKAPLERIENILALRQNGAMIDLWRPRLNLNAQISGWRRISQRLLTPRARDGPARFRAIHGLRKQSRKSSRAKAPTRTVKKAKGKTPVPSFYEFFAGGGMARAGLGPDWTCLFANDIDLKKGTSYAVNWGAGALKIGDVADVTPADLPAGGDLAWASFPCQDLSLAGDGAGLKGERSGTFWPFWKVMKALASEGRAPRVIVLENVCGALT